MTSYCLASADRATARSVLLPLTLEALASELGIVSIQWPLVVQVPGGRCIQLERADYENPKNPILSWLKARQVFFTPGHVLAPPPSIVVTITMDDSDVPPPTTRMIPHLCLPSFEKQRHLLRHATNWTSHVSTAAQYHAELMLAERRQDMTAKEWYLLGCHYSSSSSSHLGAILFAALILPQSTQEFLAPCSESFASSIVEKMSLGNIPLVEAGDNGLGERPKQWARLARLLATRMAPWIVSWPEAVRSVVEQMQRMEPSIQVDLQGGLINPSFTIPSVEHALTLGMYPGEVRSVRYLVEHIWPAAVELSYRNLCQTILHGSLSVDLVAHGSLPLEQFWSPNNNGVQVVQTAALTSDTELYQYQHIQELLDKQVERDAWLALNRGSYWQAPRHASDRIEKHATIRQRLPSLHGIMKNLPPCMQQTLETGRRKHHLLHSDRRALASWLVAIQPLDDAHWLDTDEELVRFSFGHDLVDPHNELASPNMEMNLTLQDKRKKRHENLHSIKGQGWGCPGIIKDTLSPKQQGTLTQCPFAKSFEGNISQCQKACSGGGTGYINHPLDHVLRSIEW